MPDRVMGIVDREPIWRRLEDKVDDVGYRVRNAPGERLRKRIPSFENRNFGGGVAVGTIEAAIAVILEETVGVPFGSDTEIIHVEPVEGRANVYTVDVDAPFENMASAKAFFESQTGFSSLLTDLIEVEDVEVLKTRPLRDTYQVKIRVED